jgi:hypothetical protein
MQQGTDRVDHLHRRVVRHRQVELKVLEERIQLLGVPFLAEERASRASAGPNYGAEIASSSKHTPDFQWGTLGDIAENKEVGLHDVRFKHTAIVPITPFLKPGHLPPDSNESSIMDHC